ncbi:MAG: hypothetical protein OEY49_19700, partial [Candidatus Heimdallarchaeota archaeon]|nr:hypothetical protein [Candidatus Heimdallarchaeota archaeon]
LGNNVENLFTNSLEAYTAKKPEIAHQVLNDQRTISISLHRKWPISSTDKLDGTSSLILRHLEKIGTYARKIAEATLNRDAAAHFDIE